MSFTVSREKTEALRVAYGETLVELGKTRPDIVVLDADLSTSTQTAKFGKAFPERFFNFGIAEQNMFGAAAGFSFAGKTPFASTFAMFAATRSLDQIRNMIGYSNANVKIVVTHAGVMTGPDGSSHQTLEDIGTFRCLPNFKVIVPADAVETRQVIRFVAAEKGPFYVRLVREKIPFVHDEKYQFRLGKADVLREGRDLMVFACGPQVAESMLAAQELAKEGVDAGVVNMSSIKPVDKDAIAKYAKRDGILLTVEDHGIYGGLGSVVADVLSEKHPALIARVGMKDVYGESGEAKPLYAKYGLDAEGIKKAIKETLAKKAGL